VLVAIKIADRAPVKWVNMPKQPSGKSPTRSILFRLTEDEYAVLAAVAYLEGVTPTELAKSEALAFIASSRQGERIQRLLRERMEHEAEAEGKLADLERRRSRSSQSPN
jgi:hypothetical protein